MKFQICFARLLIFDFLFNILKTYAHLNLIFRWPHPRFQSQVLNAMILRYLVYDANFVSSSTGFYAIILTALTHWFFSWPMFCIYSWRTILHMPNRFYILTLIRNVLITFYNDWCLQKATINLPSVFLPPLPSNQSYYLPKEVQIRLQTTNTKMSKFTATVAAVLAPFVLQGCNDVVRD